MRALFTASTGMEAQQMRIDSIANNIANINTTGFKKSRAEFQDLFYETLRAPGATGADGVVLPSGIQVGHGVSFAATNRVFSQGDRLNTSNPLDVAIDGNGFIQITLPDGETQYTRNGNLHLDSDGNLVNAQGYLLEPVITVPIDATTVTILADGTVSVQQPGGPAPTTLGQIELARFVNPSGLRAEGGNLYSETEASGAPETGIPNQDGFGGIAQGFLESSNVNTAEELVQMILAQRAFEVNTRVIRAGDEMLQAAAQLSR